MTIEIVNLKDCEQFITKDGSGIREILAPRNSGLEQLSLAEAVVPVGAATIEHLHKTSEEIYFILSGEGEIIIDGETALVRAGDAVVLLPGRKHKLYNRGDHDLVFLCVCSPTYEHDDTVLTESE